jgi:hypothetical protein
MPHVGPFEIDGKKYFTLQHAAEIIGPAINNVSFTVGPRVGIPPGVLISTSNANPSSGMGRATRASTVKPGSSSAKNVPWMLKRLLTECRPNPHRPSKFTNDEIATLRAAERRLRLDR